MANRLKAYVRRTILASAVEGAYPAKRRTAESTESAFKDAMHGTDTGWWSDLIYTADLLELANRYRGDVAKAIRQYLDDVGGKQSDEAGPRGEPNPFTFADIISAAGRRYDLERYRSNNDEAYSLDCDALMFGLRFAVEWYAGELAREYCPNL